VDFDLAARAGVDEPDAGANRGDLGRDCLLARLARPARSRAAAIESASRPLVNRSEVAARIGHVARRVREELDLTLANVVSTRASAPACSAASNPGA
jgi:hypothetical protein